MSLVLHFLDFILSNLEEFDKFIELFNIFSNVTLQFLKHYLHIYGSYFTSIILNLNVLYFSSNPRNLISNVDIDSYVFKDVFVFVIIIIITIIT